MELAQLQFPTEEQYPKLIFAYIVDVFKIDVIYFDITLFQ